MHYKLHVISKFLRLSILLNITGPIVIRFLTLIKYNKIASKFPHIQVCNGGRSSEGSRGLLFRVLKNIINLKTFILFQFKVKRNLI